MNQRVDRPAVFSPSSPAGGPAVTADVPEVETWNLDDLYSDLDAFDAAREDVLRRSIALPDWRGRLSESAVVMADALDAISEVTKDLNRLYSYASMRSDTDTRVAAEQGRRQEVELLWTENAERTAWLRPEILALAPERIRAYIEEDQRLAPYGHFLEDLMRTREHVLSPPEENLLAQAGLITGAANSLFGVFHNAEMPRPEVELSDGTRVAMTPANFARHRTSPNRQDRERLFHRYFEAYVPFRGTLGHNLYDGLKAHVFRARARKYPSCLDAALDGDAVPVTVYENLVRQVRDALPVLHRYLRLRARALGLERPEYHDLHCPIVADVGKTYSIAEGASIVRSSMSPLGGEYLEALDRCFRSRWIDWHPTDGKRSGAYSAGSAYDVHPYILMNFTADYESVSTLTHELGHAMHSHFSNQAQPYATADYSIFVAEVASTFNEALLGAHMFEIAESDRERRFLLGTYLDQMRATLFRQTMFAEFELEIHRRAESGQALTGESLCDIYLGILRDYHGHDAGVMDIPDRYGIEWAAVPHFYYNFYVYQYATGIVASTALADAVLSGSAEARTKYQAFLSAGGSDYPLEILRRAGVDLEETEPYRRTFDAIGRAMDTLEGLLDGQS